MDNYGKISAQNSAIHIANLAENEDHLFEHLMQALHAVPSNQLAIQMWLERLKVLEASFVRDKVSIDPRHAIYLQFLNSLNGGLDKTQLDGLLVELEGISPLTPEKVSSLLASLSTKKDRAQAHQQTNVSTNPNSEGTRRFGRKNQ